MKKNFEAGRLSPGRAWLAAVAAAGLFALGAQSVHASVAYGTINNFDTVNDTGTNCYGFEIELEDCESRSITYCYSYNHYGTPVIREDRISVPGHTNCFIRYAGVYTNGHWSAYTAVPSAPIAPTQGHSFVNPSVNFGGEHFGVGYYGSPTAVKYNWLQDNGAGVLAVGPAVQVATPAFTYYPPAGGLPAQVAAVILPPPERVEPVEGFGPATWAKSIVTTSHTNREIKLRDLVSDDPAFPNEKTWRNGEPDEVESEWDLLQEEFGGVGGGGVGVRGRNEGLPGGDEVITRRYEFYSYVGPTDPASHEALASKVGADGIHGTNEGAGKDFSNVEVVGEYLGAQMSAFDQELPLGLTERVADGKVNVVYPTRTIVIAGIPFTATNTGVLPTGMTFNRTTGELSGTPTQTGVFTFKVRVSATNVPPQERSYTFAITAANVALPPHSTVDTVAYPLDKGDTVGTGLYTNGNNCTVTAAAKPGYRFSTWTDNDKPVSTSAAYQFPVALNRSLVANFIQAPPDLRVSMLPGHSHRLEWITNTPGCVLQETANFNSTNWTDVAAPVSVVGSNAQVTLPTQTGAKFYRLKLP